MRRTFVDTHGTSQLMLILTHVCLMLALALFICYQKNEVFTYNGQTLESSTQTCARADARAPPLAISVPGVSPSSGTTSLTLLLAAAAVLYHQRVSTERLSCAPSVAVGPLGFSTNPS